MDSLRHTANVPVLAIANPDDRATVRAWGEAGAHVWPCWAEPGTFAQKANTALPYVNTEWFLLVGDDVRFHSGWAERALEVADDDVAVIGTNDLGTPAVQAGYHATHMLIRTSYARERGASWDGPGVVAHEGYWHWFVDNELVAVARQRGVWAHAAQAVIEHLHPYFGRADTDEVYALGESRRFEDAAHWEERVRQHAPELMQGAPT